ncbi:MAG: hypothetical protein Q7U35_07630 [Methanobacteriaceae archaeon]|nr:hypothetical protein [Methanobacteriaceae archaeon]MDP3034476.1 hypothetical protein [Methanobacteriaceae archaeon]MDP3484619.1 hypothetical protein [Methanobacteriaceae archaeon]MDP3622942.1 hypothetical protein [Methanobacteriaceae archaeon]
MTKKSVISGTISIKSSSNEKADFMKLLEASNRTGVPIVLTGDRISNFEITKDGKPMKLGKISGIKFILGALFP